MKSILKVILILILVLLVYNNIDLIKQDIQKTFKNDYCSEMYKGRGDYLINKCINE